MVAEYESNDKERSTNEILMDVRLDIRELNTKMDGFRDVHRKVEENTLISAKALQSADAAHKRLDLVNKIVFWACTTIIGGLVIGAIAVLFNSQVK